MLKSILSTFHRWLDWIEIVILHIAFDEVGKPTDFTLLSEVR